MLLILFIAANHLLLLNPKTPPQTINMYVTRPLSRYYQSPDAAFERPPAGPGSGIIVIQDEEAEAEMTCCWGFCSTSQVYGFPFPQNRKLTVRYSTGVGENQTSYRDDVFFIPVVGEPLSSNRYYAIKAGGRNKGNAWTCSKEEDQTTCCICTFTHDFKPIPLRYDDLYQQIEMSCKKQTNFYAKAVAPDGIPPQFLRRSGWRLYSSVPTNYTLGEALGLNAPLRAQLPELRREIIVPVGKWYCPFVFVKEGDSLKDQMKRSMFYEVTLEQLWKEIYTCEDDQSGVVEVSVDVRRELGFSGGREVVQIGVRAGDGLVWFGSVGSMERRLGLSEVVWERMRWEEERGGWVGGERVETIKRVEVFQGEGGWKRFGCYVLVERFVFKRVDGSLAFTYEFMHTNKIRVKWE